MLPFVNNLFGLRRYIAGFIGEFGRIGVVARTPMLLGGPTRRVAARNFRIARGHRQRG